MPVLMGWKTSRDKTMNKKERVCFFCSAIYPIGQWDVYFYELDVFDKHIEICLECYQHIIKIKENEGQDGRIKEARENDR